MNYMYLERKRLGSVVSKAGVTDLSYCSNAHRPLRVACILGQRSKDSLTRWVCFISMVISQQRFPLDRVRLGGDKEKKGRGKHPVIYPIHVK